MARVTSTPLMPGIMRSVITRSGGQSLKVRKSLFRIVCCAHVVSLRRERGAQHPRNLRFVVDNKNSSGHEFLLSSEDYTTGNRRHII